MTKRRVPKPTPFLIHLIGKIQNNILIYSNDRFKGRCHQYQKENLYISRRYVNVFDE